VENILQLSVYLFLSHVTSVFVVIVTKETAYEPIELRRQVLLRL
jgi:hypothetical protein